MTLISGSLCVSRSNISPSTVILTFFLWLVIVSQDLPQWTSLSLRVDNRAPMHACSPYAHVLFGSCVTTVTVTDTISGSENSTVMLIHDHGMKLSGYHLIIMQMAILGEQEFSTKFERPFISEQCRLGFKRRYKL